MAKTNLGLGRGLDALIDTTQIQTEGSSSINEVEISQIQPNPNQPRRNFDETALHELAQSIKEHGVIAPITLRKNDDGKYIIINGNYYADYAFIGIAEHSLLFKDNAFVSVFFVIFGLANLLVVAFLLSLNRKLKEKKQKDKPKDQKVEEPEEMEELIVEIVEPITVEYVSPEEAENMDSDGAVEISIVNDSSEE